MAATRYLIVVADDFGIGPETSRGILDLASRGVVTAAALLANSPYAAEAVRSWRQAGAELELGWHPCLTMDPPAAGPGRVPSLVGPDGFLRPLGRFLARLAAGFIRHDDLERELTAQYHRFAELTGRPPGFVNSHQHVGLFPPISGILHRLLRRARPLPYLRRVQEPPATLAAIPGARFKRAFLTFLGRTRVGAQRRAGFPGANWTAGVTDPRWVKDADFFVRLVERMPGGAVELCCHPGRLDPTLLGRDCRPGDGLQQRRVDEWRLLADPSFDAACRRAGFVRVSPSEWVTRSGLARAA